MLDVVNVWRQAWNVLLSALALGNVNDKLDFYAYLDIILSEIRKMYFWYCACILVIGLLTLILPVSNTKHAFVDLCKCLNKHSINMWSYIYCFFLYCQWYSLTGAVPNILQREYPIRIWLSYRQKRWIWMSIYSFTYTIYRYTMTFTLKVTQGLIFFLFGDSEQMEYCTP